MSQHQHALKTPLKTSSEFLHLQDRDVFSDDSDAQQQPLLHDHAAERPTASTVGTFFIFLKSYLGSGIMGMAAAYLSGGVFAVTALIYFIAVLSCVCFIMVFRIRDHILATQPSAHVQTLTFERIVEHVLGPWGKRSVVAALIFTQAGFATAYVIFVANNLNSLYPQLSFYVYAALQIVPLILLCWIRNMKYISPVAFAGIGAIWLAVGTVVYYCFADQLIPHGVRWSDVTRMNWATLPVAFGVVVYLFEGVGLILPLESKMTNRARFPAVMWSVHLFVSTVVALFGVLGYLAFRELTCGPIILNLPTTGWLFSVVVWGLNIALIFTYPIQMLPVFQIAEDYMHTLPAKWGGGKRSGKRSMLLRAVIVVLSVAVGCGIPYFELFLSLIGGLGSAQLMFIIPPIR
jgi:proton-coupled amino acid transporter